MGTASCFNRTAVALRLLAAILAHDTRTFLRKHRKKLHDVEAPEEVRRGGSETRRNDWNNKTRDYNLLTA